MKFARFGDKRVEATPKAVGVCNHCESELIAKCGEVRVPHWAHKGKRLCDPWWENETEWHRAWKGHFPAEWQEFSQRAENGERHIADVKTDQEWVLEFQHSHLRPDERRSRESFYSKLIWVVDGVRRKKDRAQFFKTVEEGKGVGLPAWGVRRIFSDECALLREWGAGAPVLFDFGETEGALWCFRRGDAGRPAHVAPLSRKNFIEFHSPGSAQRGQDFALVWKNFGDITLLDSPRPMQVLGIPLPRPIAFRRGLRRRF